MKNEIAQFVAAEKAFNDATRALDQVVLEAIRCVQSKAELKALLVSLPKNYKGSETVRTLCEHCSLHYSLIEGDGKSDGV